MSDTDTLRHQQVAFQRAIVEERDELAPAWRTPAHRPDLLRIYQFAHGERLMGALRDNFGVLPQVMGDEAFDALARAYVQAHPSRHPSIRWFGHHLVDFMVARSDLVPHPALTDLARMEWALRTAFDAPDAACLTAADLAGVPGSDWPRLVFSVHPSVQILRLTWAVEPVWQATKAAEDSASEPSTAEPEAVDHRLVVWRAGLDTRWRTWAVEPCACFEAAQAGETFAQLCVRAAQRVGEEQAAGSVVADLQAWLADGWLTAWRLA